MKLIEFKRWDTDFFGEKTGKVIVKVNTVNTSLINKEIDSENYSFLYYFHDVKDPLDINSLSALRFRYIDTHAKLILNLDKLKDSSGDLPPVKRLNEKADTKKLLFLGQELAKKSRFYLDQKVPRDKVIELYNQWIKNSINGSQADYFYSIGKLENPWGFVTYKKESDKEIKLILIVIGSNNRTKGLGKHLVLTSLAKLKDFQKCSVVVSMSNTKAVNFYLSLGFRFKEQHLIFHRK